MRWWYVRFIQERAQSSQDVPRVVDQIGGGEFVVVMYAVKMGVMKVGRDDASESRPYVVRESVIEGGRMLVKASMWWVGRGRLYFSPREGSFWVAE
jgi:hypothetical protein